MQDEVIDLENDEDDDNGLVSSSYFYQEDDDFQRTYRSKSPQAENYKFQRIKEKFDDQVQEIKESFLKLSKVVRRLEDLKTRFNNQSNEYIRQNNLFSHIRISASSQLERTTTGDGNDIVLHIPSLIENCENEMKRRQGAFDEFHDHLSSLSEINLDTGIEHLKESLGVLMNSEAIVDAIESYKKLESLQSTFRAKIETIDECLKTAKKSSGAKLQQQKINLYPKSDGLSIAKNNIFGRFAANRNNYDPEEPAEEDFFPSTELKTDKVINQSDYEESEDVFVDQEDNEADLLDNRKRKRPLQSYAVQHDDDEEAELGSDNGNESEEWIDSDKKEKSKKKPRSSNSSKKKTPTKKSPTPTKINKNDNDVIDLS